MAGQTISIAQADAMIEEYYNYMTGLGVDMDHQTKSVAFTKYELTTWLGTVMPYADELRIFMGCYPDEYPDKGRTSVILWPYRDGAPATDDNSVVIDPFNDGAGQP